MIRTFLTFVRDAICILMLFWPAYLIGAMIFFCVHCARADHEAAEAFMAECMADGRKHYECQAMQNGSQVTPVVVPMPMVVGR